MEKYQRGKIGVDEIILLDWFSREVLNGNSFRSNFGIETLTLKKILPIEEKSWNVSQNPNRIFQDIFTFRI